MGNFLLAFPGLNQGRTQCAENRFYSQKSAQSRLFLTQKEKPGKRGTFSLGFSRLFQAFQETPQSRRSQECNVVDLLLAFPGFSGNPGIQEKPGCARNHSSQKLRALFAHKEKPGKRGNFLLIFQAFPGFSRLSRKPRNQGTPRVCQQSFQSEAPGFFAHKEKPGKRGNFLSRLSWLLQEFLEKPGKPGHSWLFWAFSWPFLICKGKPRILPRNSGKFLAPFCRSCYQQLLAVADSCRQLLVVTSSWWQLLVVGGSYWQLSVATSSYQQLQVVTSSYQQLSVDIRSYQQLVVVIGIYQQLLVVTSSWWQLVVVGGSYQQLSVVTSSHQQLLVVSSS